MKKFLLFAALFGIMTAQAQTVAEQEQAAQIAQLQQEVTVLKKKSATWDKIAKALPKISGYAQVRYDFQDGDAGTSSFQLRRVRLSLSGDISPKLDYKFQAELKSFKLLDAYFSYKPYDELNLRAGQFKLPFTIENTDYSPTKIEFIDYPMALTYLVGYDEAIGNGDTIKANGRDLGLKLYGTFCDKIIGYDIGVFNGRGLNLADNNKSKDVVARLSIRPVDGLLISGSYMWGEYGEEYFVRERWSFGVCYDKDNWVARAEYIGGKTGEDIGKIGSDGWYVMGGYHFCKDFMVVARYDSYSFVSDRRNDTTTSAYTAGINWQPIKHFKLMANYVFTDYHRLADGALKNTHGFQVQAAAMF